MLPIYRPVKAFVPYCPTCTNRLTGDGSIMHPYMCNCGQWRYIAIDGEYEIIPKLQ